MLAKELWHEGALRGWEEGYSSGFSAGRYGHLPAWFKGRDAAATAQFYFDQIAGKSGPVASADDLVSDVSGIEGTIELE